MAAPWGVQRLHYLNWATGFVLTTATFVTETYWSVQASHPGMCYYQVRTPRPLAYLQSMNSASADCHSQANSDDLSCQASWALRSPLATTESVCNRRVASDQTPTVSLSGCAVSESRHLTLQTSRLRHLPTVPRARDRNLKWDQRRRLCLCHMQHCWRQWTERWAPPGSCKYRLPGLCRLRVSHSTLSSSLK